MTLLKLRSAVMLALEPLRDGEYRKDYTVERTHNAVLNAAAPFAEELALDFDAVITWTTAVRPVVQDSPNPPKTTTGVFVGGNGGIFGNMNGVQFGVGVDEHCSVLPPPRGATFLVVVFKTVAGGFVVLKTNDDPDSTYVADMGASAEDEIVVVETAARVERDLFLAFGNPSLMGSVKCKFT